MSTILRRDIPLLTTALLTMLMLVEYFIDVPALRYIGGDIRSWGVVIAAFVMPLGIITMVRNNLNIIRRRDRYWPYHLWSIIVLFTMIGAGLIGELGKHTVFLWLYNNVMIHLSSTMYSILAFFITTASARAFRARNIDSALVLISGVFVILTVAPIGGVIWSGIPVIGNWFLDIPNMAGMRGIIIGIGLGILALGVRTILGYERGHLGAEPTREG